MADANPNAHAVTFYAYPKLIFAWPIIVLGVAFWMVCWIPGVMPAADAADPYTASLELLGWLHLLALVLVILTIAVDVERNYAFVWSIIFLLVFFGGKWLASATDIQIFGALYDFLADMDIQYSKGAGLALSVFLGIPFLVMLVWSRINHKWRITHNEFEHYSWGRSDDSLARGAKRFRSTYPDLLEFILGLGAGTLIVYSATGRTELRRIHNVPMLPMLRKKIDHLLEYTAVTSDGHGNDARAADLIESEEEEDEPGAEEEGGGPMEDGGESDAGIGDERL